MCWVNVLPTKETLGIRADNTENRQSYQEYSISAKRVLSEEFRTISGAVFSNNNHKNSKHIHQEITNISLVIITEFCIGY